jgi:positive regulator of sigma E activity
VIDRRGVALGYSLPLVSMITTAAASHGLAANDALVACAGLLGLGIGAWLAGCLNRRLPIPIRTDEQISIFTFSFRKERQ